MTRNFFTMAVLSCALAHFANADPYTLNTGERLLDSEYLTTKSFIQGSRLIAKVHFENEANSSELRNESLIEILTEHLLPEAVKTGQDQVSIWEVIAEDDVGPSIKGFSLDLTSGAYQNYDFKLGEDWIWYQKAGPSLDLSVVEIDDYDYNPELGVYITKPIQMSADEWVFFEVWASANEGSPSLAIEKANDIFRYYSGCSKDGVTIQRESFLGEREAIALRINMLPKPPKSPLHLQPKLRLTFGHTENVLYCSSIDSRVPYSWDEVYAQISQ